MIEKLRQLLFEPRYPVRYVGRHRAPGLLVGLSVNVRPVRVDVRARTF